MYSDSVDESSNTIPMGTSFTQRNSFSMGDTEDSYVLPNFSNKKDDATPIIEEDMFSSSPIQPSRSSSDNDGMRAPTHAFQSPLPSHSLATGTIATVTPLFAFREPELSQLDDSVNTSEERTAPPFTPIKQQESGSMPAFSSVDLDMGSLEVLNDPSMYARARTNGKQGKPSPNHLTLHAVNKAEDDERETQVAQENEELDRETQVMPVHEVEKLATTVNQKTGCEDESQTGEIRFNFDFAFDELEKKPRTQTEMRDDKYTKKGGNTKKDEKGKEDTKRDRRGRKHEEDKIEVEKRERAQKEKELDDETVQSRKEQERARKEKEEAQRQHEAQKRELEKKQIEQEKLQREKEEEQKKSEQNLKQKAAVGDKEPSTPKTEQVSKMGPPVEPPKKAERKHFITVSDIPDSQDQPVACEPAPQPAQATPTHFHECEPTPDYTDFVVSKVKMPEVKQTFSSRRRKGSAKENEMTIDIVENGAEAKIETSDTKTTNKDSTVTKADTKDMASAKDKKGTETKAETKQSTSKSKKDQEKPSKPVAEEKERIETRASKASKSEDDSKKGSEARKRKLPFEDTPRRGRSKEAVEPETEKTGWKARRQHKTGDSPEDKNTARMVRRSRREDAPAKTPFAKSPKDKKIKAVEPPRRKTPTKPAEKLEEPTSSNESKRPARRVSNKRKRYTTSDTQDEIDWIDEEETPTKKKPTKGSSKSPKESDSSDHKEAEEEPVVKRKVLPLFKGMNFALTGISKDSEAPDNEKVIKQLIKDHGGRIVDTHQFQANPNKMSPKKKTKGSSPSMPGLVLLADKPRRTLKYILAVTTGIPCVNYKWIVQCCDKESLLPIEPNLLPAGSLIDSKKPVYIHAPSTDVFHDLRVEVVGTSDFKEGWTQVLRSAGARVVQRLFSSAEGRVECVLSDPSPDDIVVEKAKKLGVPVCSVEWLIQSILAQKPAKYDGHPSYYTFEEQSDD